MSLEIHITLLVCICKQETFHWIWGKLNIKKIPLNTMYSVLSKSTLLYFSVDNDNLVITLIKVMKKEFCFQSKSHWFFCKQMSEGRNKLH